MAHPRRFVPALVICVIAAAILYAGWATLRAPADLSCSVCGRPVHLASRVDGVENGKTLTFCCAACALRKQDRESLRVTRVFDYESGTAFEPEAATAVVGSNVNLCMREHVLMDAHKEASELHFDRCAPSVLTFASRDAAERFRDTQGGVVERFTDLEATLK